MSAPMPWFVLPALVAIARNVKGAGRKINAAQLSGWATSQTLDFPLRIAEGALTTLQFHGWCSIGHMRRYARGAINAWVLTPAGLQAARAAMRFMPGAGPDVAELSTRTWNLLRIRRRLTAEEAAQTLVDADADFNAEKKRIGAALAAWAKYSPKAVAVGQKREAGHLRYVLQQDLGRWPPVSGPGQIHPSRFANVAPTPACYLLKTEGGEHA